MHRSLGFDSDRKGYADISISVSSGKGREWTPELPDASWRSMSELDLSDPAACADFVSRRGDPTGDLRPGHSIITLEWANLAEALTLAAEAWQPSDARGNSWPTKDRAALARVREQFLALPYVKMTIPTWRNISRPGMPVRDPEVEIGFGPSRSGLTLNPRTLGAFMILRAIHALEDPVPMRRCRHCSLWFEIRRIQRCPQFCSPSCRAIYHQENPNGIISEEHHEGEKPAVAKRMAGAGVGRKDKAANQELRQPKASSRARPTHGAGSRTPRRRRPAKT
jgi:hypothetical protein